MRTAAILHGTCDEHEYLEMDFPSPSNAHWLPWLQQKFLRSGVLCQTPEMPAPYDPQYEDWKSVFDRVHLQNDSIIVGHSAGCGFVLKWLQEHPQLRLKNLVLVAPWLDPQKTTGDFLRCTLDKTIADRIESMHVFYSNDETVSGVVESKEAILKTYPKAKLHLFENMGHFCSGEMGTNEFPALWDAIK